MSHDAFNLDELGLEPEIDSPEMAKAVDVLHAAALGKMMEVVKAMTECNELSPQQCAMLTGYAAACIGAMQPDESLMSLQVLKALDYGSYSTDTAARNQGGALVREAFAKKKAYAVPAMLSMMLERAWRPWEGGETGLSMHEARQRIADALAEQHSFEEDEAIEAAEEVMKAFLKAQKA